MGISMNRAKVVTLVDLGSFIALISLISTGALLKFSLPPRSGGHSILGLTRHDWGEVHFYISVCFLVFMSLHLVLHRQFIKSVFLGRGSREHNYRVVAGLVGLLTIVLFLFAPVFISPN